ncbi:hypothetical protein Q0601_20755 [Paracoccus onubensis]|uniref:hypothetical protein n=1 Tax=Paracoccus onubensis TaxID=1675788 RepID=UPI00272F4C6E|nr:hypothetical protein [Paracoccus onubensis]MDP0929622.1 hypothetical protein [Paracoccus onubensis]
MREFNGKRWQTIREADKTDAEPINRHFLAALLRRADGVTKALMDHQAMRNACEAQWAEAEKQRERYRKDVEQAVEHRTRKLAEGAEAAAEFEAEFGSEANFRSIYSGIRDPKSWERAARASAVGFMVDDDADQIIAQFRLHGREVTLPVRVGAYAEAWFRENKKGPRTKEADHADSRRIRSAVSFEGSR